MPFNPDESTWKAPPAKQWNDLTREEQNDILRRTPQPQIVPVQQEIHRAPPAPVQRRVRPVLH